MRDVARKAIRIGRLVSMLNTLQHSTLNALLQFAVPRVCRTMVMRMSNMRPLEDSDRQVRAGGEVKAHSSVPSAT